MSAPAERPRNRLLRALSNEDWALLHPLLHAVDLPFRYRLQEEHRKIEFAYFPEKGIAFVVAIAKRGRRQSEVGLVGYEGMTGQAILTGMSTSLFEIFMQAEGNGYRISADDLRAVMDQSPTLRRIFLTSVYFFMVQVAYTALSNAQGLLEERLARWLLMAKDRIDEDEMMLTHEFLALMLGVQRSGVTIALQHLSGRGLISTQRGSVTITDRSGLEESAAGLYGSPESEMDGLYS